MTTVSVIETIRQLADLAEIRGLPFEAAEWRDLAGRLERSPADLASLRRSAERDDLGGPATMAAPVHSKLRAILLADSADLLRAEWSAAPWLLHRLHELAGVESSTAATLARLGILTMADLELALADGYLGQRLPGGDDRLRVAAEALSFERRRIPLGRAVDLVHRFIDAVAGEHPGLVQLRPAGDVRRFEPLVESLAVVGSAAAPEAALEAVLSLAVIQHVRHRTSRRALVAYQQVELDVHVAAPDELGTVMHATTGSPGHLAAMRARQRASRLFPREEDLYSHAGLPWIAPELRQGAGELDAAAAGHLPPLVERQHIRGDLHIHSTYSDGRDSLADMVRACARLGYEYVAITDHSERASASRTLTVRGLGQQRREIERVRRRYPRMTILHGAEVDIMPDGSLDFPDAVLEGLDIVLASLHDPAGHDPERLTRRYLDAIEHPLVNVITHPSNRLVGRHAGYQLDFDRIFAAAAATGTALEIDGAPGHLDMDGELARAAVAAGVTVTIDSDCHRADLLDRQMGLGLGTARRGWVEPRHVLNTRPLAEVRAFIEAKRRQRVR